MNTNEQESDEKLMSAYQLGDVLAFETLYKRHSGKIYGYLQARIRDRGVVDDLFQATFLNLHRARSKYNAALPFLPWLFAVCRNALLDYTRRNKRSLERSDSDAVDSAIDERMTQIESGLPEEAESLPLDQRQALEMRFRDELAFKDIAKHLDTSPANARQLVSRAVRKLQFLMNMNGRVK
ncbi:sigma-70 family RNA polymerase sigma factor [Bdellovibrionota bacterium FG-2]